MTKYFYAFLKVLSLFLFSSVVSSAFAQADLPTRIEYHVIKSSTLSGEDFLLGKKGRDVNLSGELRLPQSTAAKYPAIVLIHGSSGIGASIDVWVHHLNQAGIATFVVDSFTGRGIVSTADDQTQLHSLIMTVDAYRALDVLSGHPRIDSKRISVIGFSKGAVGSVFSASKRFKENYGSSNLFAAHIGLYTPCNSRFIGDTELTGKPMRLFHGTDDDRVSVANCRPYVKTLQEKGIDITLTEFPDTQHGYDSPLLPKSFSRPKAQTTRNCSLIENPMGVMIDEKTGAKFDYQSPCVVLGGHTGYNPESTQKTMKAVLEFLKTI
jgi:dienelactone hydrolase